MQPSHHRQLTEAEIEVINKIVEHSKAFSALVGGLTSNPRAIALAQTKIDEARMWAVQAVTQQ